MNACLGNAALYRQALNAPFRAITAPGTKAALFGTEARNMPEKAERSFIRLVEKTGDVLQVKRPIIPASSRVGDLAGRLIGKLMGDVTVTREEITGLMSDLLYVDAQPAGTTKLTDWAQHHSETLGRYYADELARRH